LRRGVRRRVQQETLGHRGRKADPLYRIRRQLLVAHERLSEPGWARIRAGLNVGDPAGEVGAAYLAKELLREVYATRSPRQARRRLERFYAHCRTAGVVELRRLAATVRRWEPEILGWHRTGLSNGPTEAMNPLIKKIKRIGHGFRNFENYRLRLLLHCGVEWPHSTRRTNRGSGHSLAYHSPSMSCRLLSQTASDDGR
jgi:transposase